MRGFEVCDMVVTGKLTDGEQVCYTMTDANNYYTNADMVLMLQIQAMLNQPGFFQAHDLTALDAAQQMLVDASPAVNELLHGTIQRVGFGL